MRVGANRGASLAQFHCVPVVRSVALRRRGRRALRCKGISQIQLNAGSQCSPEVSSGVRSELRLAADLQQTVGRHAEIPIG
jgi:hypothetical protein